MLCWDRLELPEFSRVRYFCDQMWAMSEENQMSGGRGWRKNKWIFMCSYDAISANTFHNRFNKSPRTKITGGVCLLSYNQHTMLYEVQVYCTVIWHFYTLWNYHHSKTSHNTKSLHYWLYSLCVYYFPWLTYFIAESLYLLISFTYFVYSSSSSPLSTYRHREQTGG